MHLALILMAKIVTIIVTSKNFKGFSEKPLTAVCFPRKLSWVLDCKKSCLVEAEILEKSRLRIFLFCRRVRL